MAAEMIPLLTAHPFLAELGEEHIGKLAEIAFKVRFKEDQLIFREFDPSSIFYLVLAGRVALEMAAPGRLVRVQTIGEGEELGWSSLRSNVNKQFQARALGDVEAIGFDGARLMALLQEDTDLGFQLMRRLVDTVAERLQATRLQVADVFNKGNLK
jgi:CRP-like cAMP-binding protein